MAEFSPFVRWSMPMFSLVAAPNPGSKKCVPVIIALVTASDATSKLLLRRQDENGLHLPPYVCGVSQRFRPVTGFPAVRSQCDGRSFCSNVVRR
jgi:hypothetical protein